MIERAPNIRQLAALAATVRHGSVSSAARAINLSQPALTQAIAGLEVSLGASLFDRSPSGMTPTEPALLLAPRAQAAIEHIGSTRVTGTQLRAFLAVARGGSYASAADITGLSPASLHRAVADLSVALGQRLIDRRGKSLILTPAGVRRARSFGLAVAELRAGMSEVAAWLGQAGSRIVIGAMPLSRARWLPEAITRFRTDHAEVDIAVLEGSYAELAGPLRDGEIDVMLGALREELPADLSQEAVFEDRPALVMRAGHPILARTDLDRAMLDYPWLLPDRTTPLRRYWEAMLGALDLPVPHVGIECGSVMMIRQLLIAGDGLTLLSPDQVSVELDADILAALPPPVPVQRTIGIITRAGWRPTRAEVLLLERLRESRPSGPVNS